mmetsp:Transcript_36694/g.57628  ORF Transcript_36694/g.57628 Transcript_36694/m.57628 type:complete len:212 (-) Transcript_36694:883-1518(-)
MCWSLAALNSVSTAVLSFFKVANCLEVLSFCFFSPASSSFNSSSSSFKCSISCLRVITETSYSAFFALTCPFNFSSSPSSISFSSLSFLSLCLPSSFSLSHSFSFSPPTKPSLSLSFSLSSSLFSLSSFLLFFSCSKFCSAWLRDCSARVREDSNCRDFVFHFWSTVSCVVRSLFNSVSSKVLFKILSFIPFISPSLSSPSLSIFSLSPFS